MKVPIKQYYNLLSKYLRSQWRWAAVLTLLILVTIGLKLALPQIMRVFLDTALEHGEWSFLIRAGLLYFGILRKLFDNIFQNTAFCYLMQAILVINIIYPR